MSWTDKRVELLKKLWADGLSASQIAKELGDFEHTEDSGRSAVIGKVHRLGLSGREKSNASKSRRTSRGVVNNIRNAKLRNESPRAPMPPPNSAKGQANRQQAKIAAASEENRAFMEEVEVAKLQGPVEPLHESAAFPKPGEYELSRDEIFALSRLYVQPA